MFSYWSLYCNVDHQHLSCTGNFHTVCNSKCALCYLPPDPADYTISLNATTYVAEIIADTPFGTPVLYLGAEIDGSALPSPSVFISIVENGLVERTFKFPNGQNYEQYFDLTPDLTTNTITIVNQIVYADDPRNAPPGQTPPTLPVTLGMNINLVAVDTTFSPPVLADRSGSVRAVVTVNPPPGENLVSFCMFIINDCIRN